MDSSLKNPSAAGLRSRNAGVEKVSTKHSTKKVDENVSDTESDNVSNHSSPVKSRTVSPKRSNITNYTVSNFFSKKIRVLPGNSIDWVLFIAFIALSFGFHLYKIGLAKFVVWDEAHFGKFAGYYLKRTFYFDVHPPLGKMLNAFGGALAGFNGTFEFDSGANYPPELDYTTMRALNAVFGALTVPLAWLTADQLHFSRSAKILVSTMTLCDTALLCISRFILLDSMLLFFTAWATFCITVFHNCQRESPFSFQWYYWIVQTGISLGLVLSVKWVGLFAIAVVGIHTLDELWEMFGDIKMPPKVYLKHWIARIGALIVIPLTVYACSFIAHFYILNSSGPGDANMSSLFQAGLKNSGFESCPDKVAYGSKVTIKNNGRSGGLLHSHVQTFPVGSLQQQVTCYHHKDNNNNWVFAKKWGQKHIPDDIEYVKDGDVLRLFHESTGRNLHSHTVPAPITKKDYEVSCYGNITVGDNNDLWRIEKIDDLDGTRGEPVIRTLVSRFHIRHIVTGCLLKSHSENLPQWGFKQLEVTCDRNPKKGNKNVIWNIELHENDKLPNVPKGTIRSKFHNNLWDVNVGMWNSNNALTPDPDKEDNLVSSPYQWPFMLTALRMCGWRDDAVKYLLIGNPVVWIASTISIIVFGLLILHYIVLYRRQKTIFKTPIDADDFWFASKIAPTGWLLHYLPFFLMGRVTYLHHYFPALYFGIISTAFMIDHIGKRFAPKYLSFIELGLALIVVANFVFFKDFVFGMEGPAEQYSNRQWYKGWKIYGDQ